MGVLAESLKARLALCAATDKILVFGRYTEISAKGLTSCRPAPSSRLHVNKEAYGLSSVH